MQKQMKKKIYTLKIRKAVGTCIHFRRDFGAKIFIILSF